MQRLTTGQYVGSNLYTHGFNGIVISENVYPTDYTSEWHYHDNPFFTFILRGGSLEKRKSPEIHCVPGMLLYYNPEEPHKNNSYLRGSRNFTVELEVSWLNELDLAHRIIKGASTISDYGSKALIIRMLAEARVNSSERTLTLECMVIDLIDRFKKDTKYGKSAPKWLLQIKDFVDSDVRHVPTLRQLAEQFGIHPVTICKFFPVYFQSNLGTYIRKRKIENSFGLLAQRHLSIESIAEKCGFSDHAHFSRMFKKHTSVTPTAYRRLLFD